MPPTIPIKREALSLPEAILRDLDCSPPSIPGQQRPFTSGGLFAGIGGFSVGFEHAGFKTSWCLDIAPNARDTYIANFPQANYLLRDIQTIHATDLTPVDVLHAGFPCQSFSGAGMRRGFKDPRGQLFFEIPRLLKEWGDRRPQVLVLENSPYLTIGASGTWFQTVIGELQRAGYWVSQKNCFELDTRKDGGLPQRRKRLFIVATRSDTFTHNGIDLSSTVAPDAITLRQIITRESVPDTYYLRLGNKYHTLITKSVVPDDPDQLYQLRKYFVRLPESGVCPTLTANMGRGGHNVPFLIHHQRLRKLTEYECLALQGFPASFDFPDTLSLSRRYLLVGNAVSPPIAQLIATQVAHFLKGDALRASQS